jgi:signal transduction histidine kinase/CheY-like chemotaxis protein
VEQYRDGPVQEPGDDVEGPGDTGRGAMPWRTLAFVVIAVLGAATVTGLILILGGANRQRDRAIELQSHSYDVMILSRTLAGTMARSEAALGRYVISGDRRIGQLFSEDWRRAGNQIERLDRLTNDNGRQQRRIDRLRTVFNARGRQLEQTALSTTYRRNRQAYARFYQAGKAGALRQIDRLLDDIIDQERTLLAQRNAAVTGTIARSNTIAGGLAMLGILLALGAIVLGWLTINADTERKLAQGEADAERRRADELGQAVAQATDELLVQEAKLRQIQKMEAVGQLTGGIAHDFNNMLAVVLGGLELAKRALAEDVPTAERHIDRATDGANRAAALTRQLLAFSREDSLKPESMIAGEIVDGMSELLDRTLGDAITLVAHDRSDRWRVRADRVQMENAVLNLAVNARDAMEDRGTLTIATGCATLAAGDVGTCEAGEHVTIAVTDTGTGMTAEVAERVFEPFFTTKPVGKGTGLGLSQIFAFVQTLGGGITIDTAPGRGTTVTMFLPRDTSAAQHVEAMSTRPEPAEQPRLSVLVVEDDPRVLATTMAALEELGHDPVCCEDPLQVPALLDRLDAVDLIVSDVLMPRQTGPEMIAEIAARHPHIAVLFVTGFAGEASAQTFGDHVLLRKPFTLTTLERAIGAAMARDRPGPAQTLAAE